jgi:hypothetical protein
MSARKNSILTSLTLLICLSTASAVMAASGKLIDVTKIGAGGITFKNVQTIVKNPDARPAGIFVDVEGVTPVDFAPAPTMTVKRIE